MRWMPPSPPRIFFSITVLIWKYSFFFYLLTFISCVWLSLSFFFPDELLSLPAVFFFSVAVCISLIYILTQDCWASVAKVLRYDVISSRWSSHFGQKCMFFPLFRRKKLKMWTKIGKMLDCVTFFMLSKKKSISSISCQILNFGEIQDGG